ncbi:matrix metalloproteinase-25, partial [Asbolus verrucosus]
LDFLTKFGYVEEDDGSSGALYTEKGISDTIKTVQRFGAIEETGILDNATLKLMSSPRCGVPDIIRGKRIKRFNLGSKGWNKRKITYFIANWSPKLGEHFVTKNIQLALDAWGKYGHLTFQKSQTPDADIIVAFGSGYHGDHFPFDGPGNILAHAFFPYEQYSFGGDIHFDADENWTIKNNGGSEDGMDFSTVALHELGHSLGLSHSTVRNSVMFPYYKGFDPNTQFQLGYDDILGMVLDDDNPSSGSDDSGYETTNKVTTEAHQSTASVYTTEASESTFPTYSTTSATIYEGDYESVDDHKTHDPKHGIPSTNSPSLPDICNGFFDAVATLREELFIFKDQYVWRLSKISKIEPGYPISLFQMFPDLPKTIKQIDAAYERPDGMIILFTGNTFWVYDGKSFIENSPRPLSDYGLPTTLYKIDAVQIWSRNGYSLKAIHFRNHVNTFICRSLLEIQRNEQKNGRWVSKTYGKVERRSTRFRCCHHLEG